MVYTAEYDDKPLNHQTINSLLENRANRIGDETFLIYGPEDEHVTFAELDTIANRIGNSLSALGVEKSDKVATFMQNPFPIAKAMFGINKVGSVFAPINHMYKGTPLSYQLNDTDPEVLIVSDRYTDRLNSVKNDLETSPNFVVNDSGANNEALDDDFETTHYESLLDASADKPPVDLDCDDEVSIVYTSGTTGKPKGCVVTYRWVFDNFSSHPMLSRTDVTHNPLPWYHVGGPYWTTTSAMIPGSKVVLWDQFSTEDFWDRVTRYEASKLSLVSVMIDWLMKQPEREQDNQNTVNKVSMIPLPGNYTEIAERFGFDFIFTGYGQTETGNSVWGLIHAAKADHATPADIRRGMPPDKLIEKATGFGLPVVDESPGDGFMGKARTDIIEATILNEKDEVLPPGEVGELAIRPKAPDVIFKQYYNKPEQTLEAFENLWFHTGDAAYRDESDNFYFVDRMRDVIRRRGENISSIQIQEAVNTHGLVEQNAVFPVPAKEGGEDEVAIAVQRVDDSLTETGLEEYLEERLPEFMVPRFIWFVEAIPTTETNKIEKYKLRSRFLKEAYPY
jgi:crotonobetaine/carnitine-CoA ligase